MTYPLSSQVSAGQPTSADHYNNLRKDALYVGQASADSLDLGTFFSRFAENLTIVYLATNRLRVPYNAYSPAAIVIGGCLLKASASVDLPASSFTGAAATYYIHAVRSAGSTTFTLSVNTTALDNDTSRVIGTCYWDGSVVGSIVPLFGTGSAMPTPGYDSGWFAVVFNASYNKTHGLGAVPKMVMLLHATDSAGATENVVALMGDITGGGVKALIGMDSSTAYIITSTGSTGGTCYSTRRTSGAGYYRLLCWV